MWDTLDFPYILIVGYETNQVLASFVLRSGNNINGIKASMDPSNFIKIVDSYTGNYKTSSANNVVSSTQSTSFVNYSNLINWTVSGIEGSNTYSSSTQVVLGGVRVMVSGSEAGNWILDFFSAKALIKIISLL